MSDQEQSIYLQTTSKNAHQIENEESSKIDGELNQYKIDIGNSSKENGGTANQEGVKIDGELKKPENNKCINIKSKAEDEPPAPPVNKEKIRIKTESMTEDLPLQALPIINEEYGESNILLEGNMSIDSNSDSGERSTQSTITEDNYSERWQGNLITLSRLLNCNKRPQQQNEALNENEQHTLKKIKIEDTSDGQFHEMWTIIQEHSSSIKDWVNILNLVDRQNNVENARLAYSEFLQLYPLCNGYWIKYANFEKRNNNTFQFLQIIEAGLRAIPISVEFWIYYTTYLRMSHTYDVEHIRNEFERSLNMCGLDYYSDKLWNDYISWEVEQNNLINAAKIYCRLIHIPTLNYLKNFFNFQEFILKNLPENILDFSEFLKRQTKTVHTLRTSQYLLTGDSRPPGLQKPEITNDIILSTMRTNMIKSWYNIHKQTANEFDSRKIYENNIKIRYFHVNELMSDQIENWKNYIDFEKTAGSCERIIFLYERCLLTCAEIEGFWLDYLCYLTSISFDVTDVFKRALFHHSNSLQLNLSYFDFAESRGWAEEAYNTVFKLHQSHPVSKEIAMRMLNVARGNCCMFKLFQYYLQHSQSKDFSCYIAIKYARYAWKHSGNINLAFNILNHTIRHNNISLSDNIKIYLTLIDMKMELKPKNDLSVLSTIDEMIMMCNSYEDKLLFSKKKKKYVKDYMNDYGILRLAKIEYNHIKHLYNEENHHHDVAL